METVEYFTETFTRMTVRSVRPVGCFPTVIWIFYASEKKIDIPVYVVLARITLLFKAEDVWLINNIWSSRQFQLSS